MIMCFDTKRPFGASRASAAYGKFLPLPFDPSTLRHIRLSLSASLRSGIFGDLRGSSANPRAERSRSPILQNLKPMPEVLEGGGSSFTLREPQGSSVNPRAERSRSPMPATPAAIHPMPATPEALEGQAGKGII